MKKLKGLVSILLILSLIFVLCACKNKQVFDEDPGSFSGVDAPTDDPNASSNGDSDTNSDTNNNDNGGSDNGTNNTPPTIDVSDNLKDLSASIHNLSYRTYKGGKPFYVGFESKSGAPDKTVTKWTSSNTKVATVSKDGKITPVAAGYTEIKVELTRTDDSSLKASAYTTVVVFGGESAMIVKENLDSKGKSLSNDINGVLFKNETEAAVGFPQGVDIDSQTGDVYYSSSNGNNITVTRISPSNKMDSMKLNSFGHGHCFSVERSGNDVYIWTDCSNEAEIARVKYQPGKTFTSSSGKVFSNIGRYISIDNTNRLAAVIRSGKYEIYSLDDLVKNGDNAEALTEVSSAACPTGYQYQNFDLCGRYIYTWWTVGNGAGEARSGDKYDCRIVCIDAITEKLVYESNLLATKGQRYSEAEGLQVKNENGKTVIYAHIMCLDPTRSLIYKYSK